MIVFVGIAVIVGVVKFKETKSMAADGKKWLLTVK